MSQPYHYFSHLKITIDNRIINIIGFLKKRLKKLESFCNVTCHQLIGEGGGGLLATICVFI